MNLHDTEIKSLRSDARKLSLVAKHLRQRANELAKEKRANDKADNARRGFFAKKANVDNTTILEPIGKDLF